jgi:hypothetical protein
VSALPAYHDLIDQANAAHADAEAAAATAIGHALRAGELLTRAKAATPHGQWAAVLAARFKGSERTARLYMQIHRNRGAIEERLQRGNALPIREAARLLADSRGPEAVRPPARNELQASDHPDVLAVTPPPGHMPWGPSPDGWWFWITPSTCDGFFYLTRGYSDPKVEDGPMFVEGLTKPARPAGIEYALRVLYRSDGIVWGAKESEPALYNVWLFNNEDDSHLFQNTGDRRLLVGGHRRAAP